VKGRKGKVKKRLRKQWPLPSLIEFGRGWVSASTELRPHRRPATSAKDSKARVQTPPSISSSIPSSNNACHQPQWICTHASLWTPEWQDIACTYCPVEQQGQARRLFFISRQPAGQIGQNWPQFLLAQFAAPSEGPSSNAANAAHLYMLGLQAASLAVNGCCCCCCCCCCCFNQACLLTTGWVICSPACPLIGWGLDPVCGACKGEGGGQAYECAPPGSVAQGIMPQASIVSSLPIRHSRQALAAASTHAASAKARHAPHGGWKSSNPASRRATRSPFDASTAAAAVAAAMACGGCRWGDCTAGSCCGVQACLSPLSCAPPGKVRRGWGGPAAAANAADAAAGV